MNDRVDELFTQLSENQRPASSIAVLNLYDGLAQHIQDVRDHIDSGDTNPVLQECLDREVPLYQQLTGIEPLPNDVRAELIQRLSDEFMRKREEWMQRPEYVEQERRMDDFIN